MNDSIVDFSYLYELASDEPQYIHDVINIFLDTVPKGILDLEQHIKNGDELLVIYKLAHFLKSSTAIIKINGMYDGVCFIERLAKNNIDNRDEMVQKINELVDTLNKALPILVTERDKHKVLLDKQ